MKKSELRNIIKEEISKISNENIHYKIEEELIWVNDDAKDKLIDETSFLDEKDFVRPKQYGYGGYNWILWVDWMDSDQYNEISNVLGFTW